MNGKMSSWSTVQSGVPQGSVLGPILFLLYINDIDSGIGCKFLKFADDTKIYGEVSSPSDVLLLQNDLRKLFAWSQEWQMLFNIEKCKCMHIGYNNPNREYHLGDQRIKTTKEEKDLGVLVNHNLSWSDQCTEAVKKANRALGMIRRTFTYKSPSVVKRLYISLVRPHLDYCVQAWRPWLQ